MEFVMELHVGPELPREADAEGQAPGPRRWKWTIIYDGPQGRQERAYELVERDAAKGLYAIDEKNSIVLPASLIGGALVSAFEVGGTMLVSSDRFDAAGPGPEDDSIVVEIVSFPAGKAESTGQQGDVPEVKGYTPISIQRAVLTRG